MALLLVRLGEDAGGRVNPRRIEQRPPGSSSRAALRRAQALGWLDAEGYVTDSGAEALATAPGTLT